MNTSIIVSLFVTSWLIAGANNGVAVEMKVIGHFEDVKRCQEVAEKIQKIHFHYNSYRHNATIITSAICIPDMKK